MTEFKPYWLIPVNDLYIPFRGSLISRATKRHTCIFLIYLCNFKGSLYLMKTAPDSKQSFWIIFKSVLLEKKNPRYTSLLKTFMVTTQIYHFSNPFAIFLSRLSYV